LTIALSSALLLSVPRAYADSDDRAECQHHVEQAESKLNQAISRHGERSHEAEEQRERLNTERQRCWDKYHGWWSAREHRWHTERDWDRDDQDRDRDHDQDHDRPQK
jgi:hypothetical protein